MKIFNIMISLLLLASYTALAQIDITKPPAAGPAPEIKIGDYQSFKLKNKVEVFVIENHKLPRVAIAVAFRRDPVMENEHVGYIDLAGSLLRSGTKNRTKQQLDEEIDFIGGTLFTSSDFIYGAALKKHMKTLVDLLADVTLNPVFPEEELDKLKKQSLSGLAFSKDQPDMIAERIQSILNYGDKHPYGEIETEASIKSITVDMCKQYYQQYFSPDHAYIAVVGDVSLNEAKKFITQYFSDWKAVEVPFHQYRTPKAPEKRRVAVVDRMNAVQSNIVVTYPLRLKLGNKNQVKAEVLNQILGGGSTSRLFLNLREDKGFTYGSYSSLKADPFVGYFEATAEVGNAVTDSAINEILNEMETIRNEMVSDEEVTLAKNFMMGKFSRSLEDPQTVAQFALNIERYWMPKDYYKNYLKNLEAVTTEDVNKMARKYITPENANIIVVGKGEEIIEKIKTFDNSGGILYYTPEGKPYEPKAFQAPEGISAETVIEKYIKSIGGRDRLKSVQDITMKGHLDLIRGTRKSTGMVWILQKAPNKLAQKIELRGLSSKTIYDGQDGITVGGGQKREIIGDNLDALRFNAEMYGILKLKDLWIETELIGEEILDERDTYKVLFKPQTGKSWVSWYDKKTGFELKKERTLDTPNGSITESTRYDDYRPVDGFMFPFKTILQLGELTIESSMIFININDGIDDKEFEAKM